MLTSTALAFAPGNPFPVHFTLTSPRGQDVTGHAGSLVGYLAATKGGAKITSPDTTLTFTEDTSSSSTARDYDALVPSTVVDALLQTAPAELWLAIQLPVGGGKYFTVWAVFPCLTARELT